MSTVAAMESAIQALTKQPLEPIHRGLPGLGHGLTLEEVGTRGWNLLAGDLPLPVMVLKESALAHNLRTMAEFCDRHGLDLAPHAKTTMSPQLVQRQLEAGAWGITVATAPQAALYRRFGVGRILLANQLVDRAGIRWAAKAVADGLDLYCLVDSVAGVGRMQEVLAGMGSGSRIKVLIELGPVGGRAGCRTGEAVDAVASAVSRAGNLDLVGVEAFEGVIAITRDPSALVAVRTFLEWFRAEATRLLDSTWMSESDELLVTAGGSIFPDVVAELLGRSWQPPRPARVVIRSGGYITHDHGLYAAASPFGDTAAIDSPRLASALEVWGVILSRPEPDLAIAGLGKRDAPYDIGLPIPLHLAPPGGPPAAPPGLTPESVNDHHFALRVAPGTEAPVGHLLGCGISHPCTAFDKWSAIPVVDDTYQVLGAVRTFF